MLISCKGSQIERLLGSLTVLPGKCGFGSQKKKKKSVLIVFGCLLWNLLTEFVVAAATFLQVLTGLPNLPTLLADVQ